jgi:hypothetical protein
MIQFYQSICWFLTVLTVIILILYYKQVCDLLIEAIVLERNVTREGRLLMCKLREEYFL